MTRRETSVCKAILKAAHDADGGQLDELQLHADANLICSMSRIEFGGGLAICNTRRWLTGVAARHNQNRKLWNINDVGEAALLELEL